MTSFQKPASPAHRGNTRFRGAMAAVLASVVLSGCGVVNNMIYKTTGDEAFKLFSEEPDLARVYHEGYRSQRDKWPSDPTEE